MKTKLLFSKYEIAQFLPIAVFAVIVMIMFAALLIDGGFLLSNRRTAQAAADAGALAGAKLLCEPNPSADIQAQAKAQAEYMVEKDGAELASDPEINGPTITVVATVQMNSFFARIFNQINLISNAKAVAGCYPLGAAQVLPLAWSCKNAVGDISDPGSCVVNLLDWTTEMKPLITGFFNSAAVSEVDIHDYGNITGPFPYDFSANMINKYMYVIMDSEKLYNDTVMTCADPKIDITLQPGKLDCDIDNDLVDDVLGDQGDRSWLDLDGQLQYDTDVDTGNGAKTLINWIRGIRVPTLATHTWLGGQTGVAASVFKAVDDLKGEVALVPIFDDWCDVNPEDNPQCTMDSNDYRPVKTSPGAQNYFHIVRFSAFYIACVDTGTGGGNKCPGAYQFICDNIKAGTWDDKDATCDANNEIKKNQSWIKSIEGYFIENYISVGNPGTGDYDVDPLVISLIQ